MIRRTLAVAHKELLQLRRDRLTLAMMIVLPLLQLLLFGYAIDTDVRHLSTVVWDQDESAASRDLSRSLGATGYCDIIGRVEGDAAIERALRDGSAHVALVIPPRYEADLARGATARVQIVVDGSDPQTVASATQTMASLAAARSGRADVRRVGATGATEVEPDVRFNPDLRTAVFIVPGLVGVLLTMTMVMLTSMALVRERERGTMEQLVVSPVRPTELVLGKIAPYVVIGYVQMTIILAAGHFAFEVPLVGSMPLLYALAFAFITANLAVGLVFSTVARTQQQAMQMSFFFLLPNMLLSGFMFPFAAMPAPARMLAQALPLTHFLRIVRGVVLKGSTLTDLGGELGALSLIVVVLITIASVRFRKKLG